MSTPRLYFQIAAECEYIKALVRQYLMSDEVGDITGPHAAKLADIAFTMTKSEAADAIREFEAIELREDVG